VGVAVVGGRRTRRPHACRSLRDRQAASFPQCPDSAGPVGCSFNCHRVLASSRWMPARPLRAWHSPMLRPTGSHASATRGDASTSPRPGDATDPGWSTMSLVVPHECRLGGRRGWPRSAPGSSVVRRRGLQPRDATTSVRVVAAFQICPEVLDQVDDHDAHEDQGAEEASGRHGSGRPVPPRPPLRAAGKRHRQQGQQQPRVTVVVVTSSEWRRR
jgi:hypothetical protein